MTKSKGFSARRREVIKFARATAHKEGTNFNHTLLVLEETHAVRAVDMPRFKPRLQRHQITGGWFSEALVVDDGDHQLYDEDVYNFEVDFSEVDNFKRHTDMTVSLMAVARPGRRRKAIGKAVEKPSKLLDNEGFEIWKDDDFEKCEIWEDDWERIYNEQDVDTRKSYSSVLRGKKG